MKLKLIPVTLLLAFGLVACGGSQPEEQAAAPEAAKPEAKAENHAEEEGGEHGEEGHKEGEEKEEDLKLTPAQLKAAGIALEAVGPAGLHELLPLYGSITPNAERVRDVTARFPGVIRTVTTQVGTAVKQGDVLATVESNESLETYPVIAPLSGVVTARNANPGEQAAEKAMFTVADLSTVWVELSLFPRDVAKVRVGQSVRIKSPDTGMSAQGKVIYVAPFGQSANQTVSARVLVDNSDKRWAPGLYVNAEVSLSESQVPLSIRNEAVQNLEGKDVVFVQGEHGFTPVTVTLGRTDGEHAELLSGPPLGARYVTRNSFILKAEMGKGEAEHGH